MEFPARKQRNTLIFSVLTLLVIGASLILSTWQILRQQEDSSLHYMSMSAASISEAVEDVLRWAIFAGPGQDNFKARLEGFFSELNSNGDLLFVKLYNQQGAYLLASRSKNKTSFQLPDEASKQIKTNGEWQGVVPYENGTAFVYMRAVKQLLPAGKRLLFTEQGSFLVVALSMQKHQSQYAVFRHNAMMQSLYLLIAALFIWAMALMLIARRDATAKADYLERFQAKLLDNMPDGLVTIAPDGSIQSINHAAYELLSLEKESLVGEKSAVLPDALVELLSKSQTHSGVEWHEFELGSKQLEILASAFKDENGQWTKLLLIRNRTRLHNLERSLAEAEKMAAVGSLAAGVAHEVRNPLAALRGFAQYFAGKLAGVKPDEEFANTMVREADRLNRVITGLLYLSRPKKLQIGTVDLERLYGEVEKLLHLELAEQGVSFTSHLAIRAVTADEDALKQAVINLVLNSLDAITERRVASPDASFRGNITLQSYEQDAYYVIAVKDNGCGMSEEQSENAFKAFYTGKDKGTGLGLALVEKTMREHQGRCRIEASDAGGTILSLFFTKELKSNEANE